MSSKFTSRFVNSRVRVFAHLTQAMSQKKEKGNRLDSIPRLGKQVWRRANVKGTRRKLLEDRITEVLRLNISEFLLPIFPVTTFTFLNYANG